VVSVTLKICFSTLACPDWTWHDVLERGARYGFDGVEIRLLQRETDLRAVPDLARTEWPTRRRELQQSGFRVAGLASSVRFDSADPAERDAQFQAGCHYIDLCEALGGEFIRVFGDVLPPEGDSTRETALQRIADGLHRLGDRAESRGIQILLETHGDFSASPPCVKVMSLVDHPSVGLVWDTHHPWRFHREPLAESWDSLGRWTRHTHWKDSVTLPDRPATAVGSAAAQAAAQLMAGHQHADYVLFRGGEFPALECLQLLLHAGYDGWHSLEWELMWHPELLGPDIALPLFPVKMRELERTVRALD